MFTYFLATEKSKPLLEHSANQSLIKSVTSLENVLFEEQNLMSL